MSTQTNNPSFPPQPSTPTARHPWRTEPEIDADRQLYLAERLAAQPDIWRGVYPFKDVGLTRADVEWLLATHEGGCGPVDWGDEQQRERLGLDLRGADLRHVNLRGLPLARICGGLTRDEWRITTLEQRDMAGVHLEGADLSEAYLEGAILRGAYLNGATLRGTNLRGTILFNAHLQGAYLSKAHLGGANLMGARLEGAYLRKAYLEGTDLRNAFFDSATNLEKVILGAEKPGFASLADVHWGDVNLSVMDWARVSTLGDEYQARLQETHTGTPREKSKRLDAYRAAVRANRQLANAMRAQGMNEEAVRFAYRAQVLQRKVLWRQVLWGQEVPLQTDIPPRVVRDLWLRVRSLGASIFSWFLDILAGYGYRPGRSVLIYLLMIASFATSYFVFGHLSPLEALVFSVTSFHGRGFLPGPFTLSNPVTALAAAEAVVGLIIEISFIATFTQRFFGR